ncbi:uncharacterized protein BDZ99DRAFT_574457 [Mytilinidion resinicola]|uniref:Efficient mitochondria targeting-associated protein 19 n=1 Tax=Mytilinidion resinicola TaxID=574789 RepID=A0A6A6YCG9_9PEZI|nr:uncharacterized protein BDZ99DRAFT_574457 [Mytilinidion resinicola]KAF2805537.1 hypothetical protein BDZ99DRAFT_574457 [Mytilinidion resinicola]
MGRRLDIVYLIFFIIHLPIMFVVDLTPFYPDSIKPAFMTSLRSYYVTTYRDQFFIAPPAWFTTYLYMELLYHVPLTLYAIRALWSAPLQPKAMLHLLLFSAQAGLTTLTCIAEALSWDRNLEEQGRLMGLYVPYVAFAVLMGVDMFGRLSGVVGGAVGGEGKKRV